MNTVDPTILTLPDINNVISDEDAAQESKEAVCDALINLTSAKVSGIGRFGEIVIGQKPSEQFVSGFLLNQIDANGEDETSDIRIAVHGASVRLRLAVGGSIQVQPSLAVYVRVLPTWDELVDPVRPIRPPARLRPDVRRDINEEARAIATRRKEQGDSRTRRVILNDVYREILAGRGVTFMADTPQVLSVVTQPGEDGGGDEATTPALTVVDTIQYAVFPDALCTSEEIPPKFKRLHVTMPLLELPIEADITRREAAVTAHAEAMERAIEAAYRAFIASDEGQLNAWRNMALPPSSFATKAAWEAALTRVRQKAPQMDRLWPKQKPEITVEWAADPVDPELVHAAIGLLHRSASSDDKALDSGLYQVGLQLSLPTAALVPYVLERVKPSYDIHGFHDVLATGWNSGVTGASSDGTTRICTTWVPRYTLPRIVAKVIPSVDVTFRTLADPAQDLSALRWIPKAYSEWIRDFVKAKVDPTAGVPAADVTTRRRETEKYEHDVSEYLKEISELEAGISILEESRKAWLVDPASKRAVPFRAWVLTNQTFLKAAERRGWDTSKAGWRLFQVAFVLANLVSPSTRIKEFEHFYGPNTDSIEAAALLYFATGGGKSEAFYGLLVFTLFLDRLRGKHRGVSALIRYPLRLLTAQQARRLARVLAEAELIRRDEEIGGDAMEIGFWVGGSSTPNRIMDGSKLMEEFECVPAVGTAEHRDEASNLQNGGYCAVLADYNKLPKCPFCDKPTGMRRFPKEQERLGIVCLEVKCRWNRVTAPHVRPLPFVLVDEDIYRVAPPILLGTVDKLALIGQHWSTINKIAGMFGLARFTDPNGLVTMPYGDHSKLQPGLKQVYPAFKSGVHSFFDPVPSLIIQDEAHLLEESLGTFAGLFETTLYHWFQSLADFAGDEMTRIPSAPTRIRLPKVVAATATISDPARQIQVLYQKRVRQFPYKGPRLYRSFYADPLRFKKTASDRNDAADTSPNQKDIETYAPWARIYVSLLTNGCPHTTGSVTVLGAFTAGITHLLRGLLSRDPAREAEAAALLRDHLSDGPLRSRHDAALARMAPNVLASIVDLHRVALTYVTNKKGGDQILSALPGIADRQHRDFGRHAVIENVRTSLISGGVEAGLIEGIVAEAEKRLDPATPENVGEVLRMIVATSAVSHGVDVENFNSMFFAGMPTAIDEYIQASSRVGRTHVGFSMLIPTPQNRRDRFVMEVHGTFHRFLERMIAPPAVERWTDKAVERAIPSLIQNWLVGVVYQAHYIKDDARKQGAQIPKDIATVRRLKSAMGEDRFIANLVQYCLDCIGADQPHGGADTQKGHFEQLVLRAVRDFVRMVEHPLAAGKLEHFWKSMGIDSPMTSLRDVDVPGLIEPYYRGKRGDKSAESFKDVMRFIRSGGRTR
ncbi:helicase-related protein [Microvirga terrae]|uniref:Helicase-related protein n=1 Tax=Microvirga terrae TaxID=2740529 RepID=A0ABY5RVL8_9HYPH|nr:DEAD/DEAH box helicase family protein [Microvirga terrae]UVF19989.1 helicase-related protein [Microvirga terrae]